MNDHHHGLGLSLSGIIASAVVWFLHNIQIIDGLMQFALLTISIAGALVGLRKVLRK